MGRLAVAGINVVFNGFGYKGYLNRRISRYYDTDNYFYTRSISTDYIPKEPYKYFNPRSQYIDRWYPINQYLSRNIEGFRPGSMDRFIHCHSEYLGDKFFELDSYYIILNTDYDWNTNLKSLIDFAMISTFSTADDILPDIYTSFKQLLDDTEVQKVLKEFKEFPGVETILKEGIGEYITSTNLYKQSLDQIIKKDFTDDNSICSHQRYLGIIFTIVEVYEAAMQNIWYLACKQKENAKEEIQQIVKDIQETWHDTRIPKEFISKVNALFKGQDMFADILT